MWSDGLRSRGASRPPASVAGTPLRSRVARDSTLGRALGRTQRVAGARASRDASPGRAATSLPRQRQLGARQPRITLHVAGSMEQADWQPRDRAGTRPATPWPDAAQSRQPGGAPAWYEPGGSRPRDAVEMLRPPVATEPAPKLILVACMVVAVGLIAGVTAYLVSGHRGSAPGGALPPSPHAKALTTPMQQAETWLMANVAADTPLCGDPAMVAQLGEARFTALSSCRPYGSIENDRFVVSTPDIRAAIAYRLAAVAGRKASLAVAVFGTGAERVEVRMVVPGAQTALSARLTRDLHERAFAAVALLHNPRITPTASARAALRRGQLDMRAATLLALLAARTPVHLDTIMIRPPEAAAGRPARSISISVTDPATLTTTTRMLTGDYIPAFVTPTGSSTQLDWPVGLAPNAGLG